jgi:hypothetical protein
MGRSAAKNRMPKGKNRQRGGPLPLPSANGSNGTANAHALRLAAPPDGPPVPAATPPPAAEGRDAGGRFARGNKGGPGNPFARRVAELRSALLEAVTPERVRCLAEGLYQRALGGDTAAAKLLLAYTLGRPAQAVDPDRLDLDEWRLRQDCPQLGDVIEAAGKLVIGKAFIMLQKLEAGAWHTEGATIVPLCDLVREAAQQGAEPTTGPTPAP